MYACIMYIVSYACKAMSDMIQQVVKESSNKVFRTQMKKVAESRDQCARSSLTTSIPQKKSLKVVFVDVTATPYETYKQLIEVSDSDHCSDDDDHNLQTALTASLQDMQPSRYLCRKWAANSNIQASIKK